MYTFEVDGEDFQLSSSLIARTETLKHLVADCPISDELSKLSVSEKSENVTKYCVPDTQMKAKTFRKAVDYMKNHEKDSDEDFAKFTSHNNLDIVGADVEYINIPLNEICDLTLAANYLDCQGLLHLCARKVATMIKGKTTEEMRKILDIKNDFSPAEEEAIRNEHSWCSELDDKPRS